MTRRISKTEIEIRQAQSWEDKQAERFQELQDLKQKALGMGMVKVRNRRISAMNHPSSDIPMLVDAIARRESRGGSSQGSSLPLTGPELMVLDNDQLRALIRENGEQPRSGARRHGLIAQARRVIAERAADQNAKVSA